jgi:hypothetical protein
MDFVFFFLMFVSKCDSDSKRRLKYKLKAFGDENDDENYEKQNNPTTEKKH